MPIKMLRVIHEEWGYIFKDRRLFGILFLVPILYTALFGYLYGAGRVTEIASVVVDSDDTQLSRQIVQAFDASESFNIIKQVRSEDEAQEMIKRGEVKVALIVPAGFSSHIKHGDVLPIMTLIDGSNMMISNSATRGANEVIGTYSTGVSAKKLQMQGLQDEQVAATFAAIPFRYRVLYNPTFNYSDFMVYGLLGAALQQVLLLGIALTITREKEQGTWERFAVWKHSPWKLAIAKSVPYMLIGMVNTSNALLVGVYGFHLPFKGSMPALLLLSATFTFAVTGIGYLASLFSKRSLDATQTAMLIAVPSFMLSGFTWPFEVMPKPISIFGHLLPLTHFLDGVRKVLVKGNMLEAVWRDCLILTLTGLITYLIAFVLTRFVVFAKKEPVPVNNSTQPLSLPAPGGGTPMSM